MELNIYGYKCKKCGHIQYPYRMVCKKCRENEIEGFDSVPLPKKGKLLTYTRLHTLPADFDVSTIQLGIVELDGGLRITGQLNIDKPKTGMDVVGKVGVVRKGAYNEHCGMIFTKA